MRQKEIVEKILSGTQGHIVFREQILMLLTDIGRFPNSHREIILKTILKKRIGVHAYGDLFKASMNSEWFGDEKKDLWNRILSSPAFPRSSLASFRVVHAEEHAVRNLACPICYCLHHDISLEKYDYLLHGHGYGAKCPVCDWEKANKKNLAEAMVAGKASIKLDTPIGAFDGQIFTPGTRNEKLGLPEDAHPLEVATKAIDKLATYANNIEGSRVVIEDMEEVMPDLCFIPEAEVAKLWLMDENKLEAANKPILEDDLSRLKMSSEEDPRNMMMLRPNTSTLEQIQKAVNDLKALDNGIAMAMGEKVEPTGCTCNPEAADLCYTCLKGSVEKCTCVGKWMLYSIHDVNEPCSHCWKMMAAAMKKCTCGGKWKDDEGEPCEACRPDYENIKRVEKLASGPEVPFVKEGEIHGILKGRAELAESFKAVMAMDPVCTCNIWAGCTCGVMEAERGAK